MVATLFDGCADACGWTAAIVSSVAFGSFGVPIKGASSKIDVNPLVMQSYKTAVCFLTCWLVVFLGEEIRWTPWGIVSGLFWVPGAACGIYGIRNAGLAIAVGTWSSIIVITSFIWGVIVFREGVRSLPETACAAIVLTLGLIGMSRYSKSGTPTAVKTLVDEEETDSSDSEDGEASPTTLKRTLKRRESNETPIAHLEIEPLVEEEGLDMKDVANKDRIVLLGGRIALTRRQLGILGAVINGAWGGTNMIPLHFAAREGFGGPGYLISYAIGSTIVNIALWIILILYYIYQKKGNMQEALQCLPDWHFGELWLPGLLAGSLYSLGNFASIVAVTYLGQAVGFSFCQGQILISGLWGICYYKEITGRETIAKWFLSAAVTILGILWLTYEHQGSVSHR